MHVHTNVPFRVRTALFDALVGTVWHDGEITLDELAATRAVARELGLPDATLARDVRRRPLEEAAAALEESDRELVLAATAWILAVDGNERPDESPAFRDAARALGIPPSRGNRLAALAHEVHTQARASVTLADEFLRLVDAVNACAGLLARR